MSREFPRLSQVDRQERKTRERQGEPERPAEKETFRARPSQGHAKGEFKDDRIAPEGEGLRQGRKGVAEAAREDQRADQRRHRDAGEEGR